MLRPASDRYFFIGHFGIIANLDYITKLTALRKSRRMSEELDFKELGKISRNKARRFTKWGTYMWNMEEYTMI